MAADVRTGRAVAVVAALGLALFTLVVTENLPIGLLPLLAADLDVSVSGAGLLVTGYAVVVAVMSVPMTALVRNVPRRRLLGSLLGVYTAACVVSGLAGDYWVLLGSRVVVALVHAVFWSVVTATAAGLFPVRLRGRVIAAVFAGPSLALVAGVPLGTWLGQRTDWRVPFLVCAAVGLAAFAVVVWALPDRRPEDNHASRASAPDARRMRFLVVSVAVVVTGMFTPYTYVTSYLTGVSGFGPGDVAWILLVGGCVGAVGTVASGFLLERWPDASMTGSVAVVAVALCGLWLGGPVPALAVASQALVNFGVSVMVAAVQARVLVVSPGSTEVGSAATSAAFNVGIGGGALVGGVLLPAWGPRSLALVGAALALCAVAVLAADRPRPSTVDA